MVEATSRLATPIWWKPRHEVVAFTSRFRRVSTSPVTGHCASTSDLRALPGRRKAWRQIQVQRSYVPQQRGCAPIVCWKFGRATAPVGLATLRREACGASQYRRDKNPEFRGTPATRACARVLPCGGARGDTRNRRRSEIDRAGLGEAKNTLLGGDTTRAAELARPVLRLTDTSYLSDLVALNGPRGLLRGARGVPHASPTTSENGRPAAPLPADWPGHFRTSPK